MSGSAHPRAMTPSHEPPTRTAAPAARPAHPRTRIYTLFGATGLVYLLEGLILLEATWNLGSGAQAWDRMMRSFQHPVYIAWHAVCLASVLFVGVRFFRLFPKAQPPSIGPVKPPPRPVIHAMLYAVWIGGTLVLGAVLAGVIF